MKRLDRSSSCSVWMANLLISSAMRELLAPWTYSVVKGHLGIQGKGCVFKAQMGQKIVTSVIRAADASYTAATSKTRWTESKAIRIRNCIFSQQRALSF
jgi:hypothetical protein